MSGVRVLRKQKTKIEYLTLIITFVTLAFLFYGCSKDESQKKPAVNVGGQEIKIAVSLADMERDGNQIIKNIMSGRAGQSEQGKQGAGQRQGQQQGQEDRKTGTDGQAVLPVQAPGDQGAQQQGGAGRQRVNITWLDAKNDPAQQEKDLDQLIEQKVKAVVLQVVDPAAGPRLVRKLAQANIKVVALETLPADSPLDGYIASDHARAGELQARYLVSMAEGRSAPVKTVILQGDKNDQASREIVSSVLENLKDYPQVQVVLVRDHPRGDPQMATATLDEVLLSTNNKIDAVIATDSRMAAAAAEMLKSRGLDQRVITVGAGADQKASRALSAGEHDAEVDVMPDLIAQYAYDAAVGLATTGHWQYDKQLRNGDFDVPAKITPVRLITKSEAYLLEQRWGEQQGRQNQQGQQQGQQGQQGRQDQQQGQQGQQGGNQKQGGNGGSQGDKDGGRKTTLRITTQDGKTVEMQINGEIKKIETIDGAGGGKAGSQGEGSSAGGEGEGKGG